MVNHAAQSYQFFQYTQREKGTIIKIPCKVIIGPHSAGNSFLVTKMFPIETAV